MKKIKQLSGEEMLAKLSKRESKKAAPITIFNHAKKSKKHTKSS